MMRLLKYILICVMVVAFANIGSAMAETSHKHKKKSHHTRHYHKTKKTRAHKRVYKPQVEAPSDGRMSMALPENKTPPPTGIASFFTKRVASVEDRMVSFVHKTVSNLKYSVYKLGGGHFEPARGVYILDCSDYVDNVLQAVDPKAYSGLVNYTGSDRPTSQHYYDFFTELDDDNIQHGWTRISDVEDLMPGDVLVFRYKRGVHMTGGHVMIVMDKPIGDDNTFLVRVADSAPSGHSHDTRQPNTSGIGIGTLLLKTDPSSGRPSAYAWKVGAPWKSNVRIAMGRPVYSS